MNDRELLELAAKAIGIDLDFFGDGTPAIRCDDEKIDPMFAFLNPWNPLKDDGDALRLAVSLCISISTGPVIASANTIQGALRGFFPKESTIESLDANEAIRRVIVRAAAEIGKNL